MHAFILCVEDCEEYAHNTLNNDQDVAAFHLAYVTTCVCGWDGDWDHDTLGKPQECVNDWRTGQGIYFTYLTNSCQH